MLLADHIRAIDEAVGDARTGLPEEVFALLCRITPMLNVDLLIQNERRETLLTWRHDSLYHGWHIPGGVVRFKERMADRIAEVARKELGTDVTIVKPEPVTITEIIQPVRVARGHFVSFLFECALVGPLDERRKCDGAEPEPGQWAWHAAYPPAMIGSHAMYRRFFERQP